jgi:hypothetical protein
MTSASEVRGIRPLLRLSYRANTASSQHGPGGRGEASIAMGA